MTVTKDKSDSQERHFVVDGRKLPARPIRSGLYIVATPIGNLGDISLRALATLAAADTILCEDTRVTRKLTSHFGISASLKPYHDHNADKVRPAVLKALRDGDVVALVSDAGTPLVSDPGYRLVAEAAAADIFISPVPGPSAALAALSVAGLPSDRFLFAGFLPQKAGPRRQVLEELKAVPATLIFFESPKRLSATLDSMSEILGSRQVSVARELTKLHEEVRRGDLDEVAEAYRSQPAPRGEVAIVVSPPGAPEAIGDEAVDEMLDAALETMPVKAAAASLVERTGRSRRDLYTRALVIKARREALD